MTDHDGDDTYVATFLFGGDPYLYSHGLGLDDVNLVPVSAPHLFMDHHHAANRVVGPAQIQQVVVG